MDSSGESQKSNRMGGKSGKRSATVYQKKEGKGKKSIKKLSAKRGSNGDLYESEEKIAFYQPV